MTIDFEHTDSDGGRTKYRLIRTAIETPESGDSFHRVAQPARLLRVMPGVGEKYVDESLIDRFLPHNLQSIFFTDGDHVRSSSPALQQQHSRRRFTARSERCLAWTGWVYLAKISMSSVANARQGRCKG